MEDTISELALVTFTLGSGRAALLSPAWERLRRGVGQALDAFHKQRPDLPGLAIEQLRRGDSPPLPQPLFLAALRKLAQSGEVSLDRTWVAATDSGVYLSLDEGRSWRRSSGWPQAPARVISLAASGESLFAGTDRSGLLISADRGATWTANSALPASASWPINTA